MTENERNDLFLKELSELTRKHKIVIGGCGCCGSPSLQYIKDGIVEVYNINKTLRWYSVNMNNVEYSHENGDNISFDKEIT